MSKPKLEVLFSHEAPTETGKRALLVLTRLPGGASVALGLEDGAAAIGVRLTPAAACALGVELLAATREVLAAHAGRMDQRTAQELAACLLLPTAEAELVRQAAPDREVTH
jgi:hypothetical protein